MRIDLRSPRVWLLPLLLLAWSSSSALALPIEYQVSAAQHDAFAKYSGGHAFWFPGLATDLVFDPTGAFVQDVGEWRLTGRVESGAIAFDVDLTFSGIMSYAQAVVAVPGTPKLELINAAYVANGGPVDPTTWVFATAVSGTFTGIAGSTYDGAILDIVMRGPAGALGDGANNKNIGFGLSSWLTATARDPAAYGLADSYHGDINVDLQPVVPEPTAVALFAIGLLVIGAALQCRGPRDA